MATPSKFPVAAALHGAAPFLEKPSCALAGLNVQPCQTELAGVALQRVVQGASNTGTDRFGTVEEVVDMSIGFEIGVTDNPVPSQCGHEYTATVAGPAVHFSERWSGSQASACSTL